MADRICPVKLCQAPLGPGRILCLNHWKALPGKMRSALSFSVRMRKTAVTKEAVDRAIDWLSR